MIVKYTGNPINLNEPNNPYAHTSLEERVAIAEVFSGLPILVSHVFPTGKLLFENTREQFNPAMFEEIPGAVVAYKYSLLMNSNGILNRYAKEAYNTKAVLWFPYLLNDASLNEGWVTTVNKLTINTQYIIMVELYGRGIIRPTEHGDVELIHKIE